MSSGFHRLGANADPELGWDNRSLAGFVGNAHCAVGASMHAPVAQEARLAKGEDGEAARAQGFTGDMCTTCSGTHMQRNGACLVCADCGTSTGCS